MHRPLEATHDASLRSWVDAANDPASDFPIQNLPFGVFQRRGSSEPPCVGVAIGDRVVDVSAAAALDLIAPDARRAAEACAAPALNGLMAEGPVAATALRRALSELLRAGGPREAAARRQGEKLLVPMEGCELLLPAVVGDYSDFYASVHHATNVGSMFRPDNPLLPNYKHVPIGYHGRASSIVASGTAVRRPKGQLKAGDAEVPGFGPSRLLDYEMELGALIGAGNALGEPIAASAALDHVFGFCLVNDWSARDIQAWEYQPLGPFLAKNFATTVAPWVVTLDALAPFRVASYARPDGDPAPLPYLDDPADRAGGGFGITLEVRIRTRAMRARGEDGAVVSRGSFTDMYWTLAQMLTHHASNGCNLRPGDLLASGTVSGPAKDSRGCMLELTWRGAEPLALPGGESRRFLEDGDEVVMRGWCATDGRARIGFGECRGVIEPALP